MQNVAALRSLVMHVGGRPVENGWDRLARYCGLPWSGGDNETWAFRYYDALASPGRDAVGPLDVLAASALHPGLSKADLAFFHDEAKAIAQWLAVLPAAVDLGGCDAAVSRHLEELATWDASVSLPLLTKVLHRKRPMLIPLLDRHILDWYRPITGERSAVKAWPALLGAMRDDLELTSAVCQSMAKAVEEETSMCLSPLRVIDIVAWMGARP